MKQIICFLVFTFLTISVTNAQKHTTSSNLIIPNSIKNDNGNLKSIIQNTFDELDLLDKLINQTNIPGANKLSNQVMFRPTIICLNDNTTRITYSYNQQGKMLTYCYEITQNNTFVNDFRYTFTYDLNGALLTNTREGWENNDWVNETRYTHTNDEHGKKLCSIGEKWENNGWVNWQQFNYTYDSQGNMLTKSLALWTNSEWLNSYRFSYSYDTNGNILTYIEEDWENGVWNYYWKYSYTYNELNNNLTGLYQVWTNDVWWDYWCYVNTFNNQGKKLTHSHAISLGGWVLDSTCTYEYDTNGNNISETWQVYGDNKFLKINEYDKKGKLTSSSNNYWVNSQWTITSCNYYTYDTQANLINYLIVLPQNDSLINNYKYEYAYDMNGNAISGNSFYWVNNRWDPFDGVLELFYNYKEKSLTYYAKNAVVQYITITDINENNKPLYNFYLNQNYPNPFNPSTTINFSIPKQEFVTLIIYDVLGKEIATLVNEELAAGNHVNTWNAPNVSSGVYFYKLQAGKFSETKKMILIR